jgi:hypothetical protein
VSNWGLGRAGLQRAQFAPLVQLVAPKWENGARAPRRVVSKGFSLRSNELRLIAVHAPRCPIVFPGLGPRSCRTLTMASSPPLRWARGVCAVRWSGPLPLSPRTRHRRIRNAGLSSMPFSPVLRARCPSPWALRFHSPQTKPRRPCHAPFEFRTSLKAPVCERADDRHGLNSVGLVRSLFVSWSAGLRPASALLLEMTALSGPEARAPTCWWRRGLLDRRCSIQQKRRPRRGSYLRGLAVGPPV